MTDNLPIPGYGVFTIPKRWGWEGVTGVFIGGCVDRGVGSSFRAAAHAHNEPYGADDENPGWICVRSPRRVYVTNGDGPSRLMMHEYAHILTPGHGHDDAWRAMMKTLGQPIPERYKKKRRK